MSRQDSCLQGLTGSEKDKTKCLESETETQDEQGKPGGRGEGGEMLSPPSPSSPLRSPGPLGEGPSSPSTLRSSLQPEGTS